MLGDTYEQVGRPEAPRQVNPAVPQEMETVCLKALAKRPDDRYPTAKELLSALENWRPVVREVGESRISSSGSKSVLGMPSPVDETLAKDLAQKAFEARSAGRLAEAADIMEEAFNKSPQLREKYASQVKLWRCGISM